MRWREIVQSLFDLIRIDGRLQNGAQVRFTTLDMPLGSYPFRVNPSIQEMGCINQESVCEKQIKVSQVCGVTDAFIGTLGAKLVQEEIYGFQMIVTASQPLLLCIFNLPDEGISKREGPVIIAPGWRKETILIKAREHVRVTDQITFADNLLRGP